jgi:hypothetical protein
MYVSLSLEDMHKSFNIERGICNITHIRYEK